MNFSSILDISSFFIGIIINLLFVALMCYYFKSKYDNLELAQNEQAKIIYDILQKERRNCMLNMCPLELKPATVPVRSMSVDVLSDESDDETMSSSSDIEELDHLEEPEIKHLSIQEQPIEMPDEISFIVTKIDNKVDDKIEEKNDEYSKMTMKQLKELLSNKGIKTKPNMRKEELIDLILKKDMVPSGSPNFGAFSSENIEIEGMEEIST
jgi:hypothetical protein